MEYFFLFIFGLAVGSFLNVVALRYRPTFKLLNFKTLKLYLGGRSKCPICHKTLVWYELIPIFSFLIQKGKCRHCGHLISLQYPLVEILSGLIFVFVPLSLSSLMVNGQWSTVIWLLVFLLFLLLSIIDFRQYIIPDSINLSLAVLGIVLIFLEVGLPNINVNLWEVRPPQIDNFSFFGHYAMLFDFWPLSIVNSQWLMVMNHLFAALIAMAFFGAIILLTKGKAMGVGDFKLVGALGLIFGWPDILMVLFLAFIIGAVFSVILLIGKKKKIKEAVPFGPFLVVASSLTFFFGYQIIDGYFKLFGL
ncbi:MAG: prepilin peptidase [bacterium]|nr:prepilin peptidase [bacterium]